MDYIALYRKYRPSTFGEVAGQETTVQILRQALKQAKIANAYLFAGPKGTGKTTVARIFAKGLNCINGPTDEPCMECKSCLSITNGNNLDVLEIDAASNRGIDEIRDLKDKVQYVAVSSKYKVYIIDEAHMLTPQAFNALLKTLEEPPKNVLFILATTEPEKIPATIISRCERFYFKPISIQDLIKKIIFVSESENVKVTQAASLLIARLSSGSLRNALSLLDQAITMYGSDINEESLRNLFDVPDERVFPNFVESVINKNQANLLQYINEMRDGGKDSKVFLNELLDYLQDIITARIAGTDFLLDKRDSELIDIIKEQAKFISPKKLIELSSVLIDTLNKIKNFREPYFPILLNLLNFIGEVEVASAPVAQKQAELSKVSVQTLTKLIEPAATLVTELKDTGELSIEKIKIMWNEILAVIKSKSISLYSMLLRATPVELKNSTLTLLPEKKFYLSLLRLTPNTDIVEQAIFQIVGSKFLVSFTEPNETTPFNKDEALREVSEKPEVKKVLKLFDGAVTDVAERKEEK